MQTYADCMPHGYAAQVGVDFQRMTESTIGERLLALKEQSGLSLAKIAAAAGYQGASSIQKLFRPDYNPSRLSRSVAERLTAALVNHGNPPILASELYALAGRLREEEEDNRQFVRELESQAETVFVYQTGVSLRKIKAEDGYIIPSFTIDMYNMPDMVATPKHLFYKGVGGFRIVTGNMWPRYDVGEIVWYSEWTPVKIGDVVLVGLKAEGEHQKEAFILGRLINLNDEEVRLHQLTPDRINQVPRARTFSIRRLLTYEDLMPLSVNHGGPDDPS